MSLSRRGLLGGIAALAAMPGLSGCGRFGFPVPPRGAGVPPSVRVGYGSERSQFARLHLPAGSVSALPVAVVMHGGYWTVGYGAELGTPLAVDLANRGIAAWNLEYRRIGGDGGWPATFADAAAGLDALATGGQQAAGGRLDLARVVAVGHSAGGHLAGWLAGRARLPAGAPGATPGVRLRGVVSQAGVLDLVDAAAQGLGGGAVLQLLGGGPASHPDRYAQASPIALLPFGIPVVCVHGAVDGIVPIRQSERFVSAAVAAGDHAELYRLPGVDHFALIDPSTAAWAACRSAVDRLLGR